jgi:hypothetical protein
LRHPAVTVFAGGEYMATINSGITMRILPLTSYNFANIQNSKNIQFNVGQHIEAGVFTEADLIVRLHTGTVMSAGQIFSISLGTDGYTMEDPTSNFFTAITGVAFTQTGAPTLPAYSVTSASATTTPFGRYLVVALSATQPAAATTFTVNVSVDLVLKGGDPSALPMGPNSFRGYRVL